jgi:hypothetical protein
MPVSHPSAIKIYSYFEKECFEMRATRNQTTGCADGATFVITGEVTKVYSGKQSDYATVKVQPDLCDYYDLYRVACPKDVSVEEGDEITASGTISTFFDRTKKVQTINFNATSVKPAK